jgi:hypothetical protein
MPPLPPVPGLIRCQLDFLVGVDAAAQTAWHVLYTGGPPSAVDMAFFASTLEASAGAHLASVMHPDTSLESVFLLDLSSSSAFSGEAAGPVVGTRSGGQLPANTAVLANYPIGRRYRGGKPRGYWPIGTSTDLDTRQTWLSGSVTAFETAIVDTINGLSSATSGTTTIGAPASISYYHGFVSVTNPITLRTRDVPSIRSALLPPDPFTAAVVNIHVSSQRRRSQIRL